MLTINDISRSLWVTKTETHILGFETNNLVFKHVLFNLKNKSKETFIFKDSNVYVNGSKEPCKDSGVRDSFVDRVDEIFNSNPFWAVIPKPEFDFDSFTKSREKNAIPESKKKILNKYFHLVDPKDKFLENTLYKDKTVSLAIKDQLLWRLQSLSKAVPNVEIKTFSMADHRLKNSTISHMGSAISDIESDENIKYTFDFSQLKLACVELISDIGNGTDTAYIKSENSDLEYSYLATLSKEEVVFVKLSNFTKQTLVLNFDKNSLSINGVENNKSNKLFISYFRQMVLDIEADKAAIT
jgi:hypothetical protein